MPEVSPTLLAQGNRTGGDRPPGTTVDTALTLIPVPLGFGGGNRSGAVEVAATLTAKGNRQDFEVETFVAQPVAFSMMPMNSGKDFKARETDVSHPLMASGPVGGNQGGDVILQPVAYRTTGNDGVYEQGETVGALTTSTDPNANILAEPVAFALRGREEGNVPEVEGDGQTTGALRAASGGSTNPHVAVAFAENQRGELRTSDTSPALGRGGGKPGQGYPAVAVPLLEVGKRTGVSTTDKRAGVGIGDDGDPMYTLQAGAQHGIGTEYAVRRLTPDECARLQGFPDGHSRISWKGKPAEECPDGPQYKTYGNSMAVKVIAWIAGRMDADARRVDALGG